MPDSKQTALEQQFAHEVIRATSKLKLFRELRTRLPANCTEPTGFLDSGYCADATLVFGESERLAELLKIFHPMPVYWLLGMNRTFKPAAALREHEWQQDYLKIYPVVLLGKSSPFGAGARWWTMHDEKRIAIEVAGTIREQVLPSEDKYRSILEHGTEAFLPYLAKPSTRPSAYREWLLLSKAIREGLPEEDALQMELAQANAIGSYLEKNILAKGYVPESDEPFYYEYLQHALETALGISFRFNCFEHGRACKPSFSLRIEFDPTSRDRSFYDLRVAQNPSQCLRLRDIPVTYLA